ncbi:Beta/gamma crystallin domain-containing protein 1 [Collichthys lucidus]|uniref:Beta/gamma crystallin domain-containing protein 1 n=1 Tax=Collichthys lucidus TaxID=240159 RepID=A0A4U5UMM8_COLLU|nr:Beta/gamma crystallin domain-containing protein 1 [Collichthys lucidus]
MFTTYIKNLNDMVFPTSESPEEQPSTGVLGRIGSWFSPWRGKGPSSPTENDSTSIDETLKSEEEDIVREQQWEEEEKEQSSNPDPLGFSRDIFPCEEKDATQSAHRDGSVVSSTERPEGGPREEEFVESRKERIGQGKGREESSNGTSESGNPEKNASHLTHHSSFSEQGVVWDSDQAHTPPQAQRETQAQTGKRLHVYLEETSVFQCGKDTRAGQEVVRTKVTKSLKVLPKTKSSQSFDSLESSTSSAENKRTNARPAVGTDSYYSALVGVSLKSRKHSQLEPVPEQTDADNMGRKNAARKKVRKNSQGDGGNSPQEKIPAANAEPLPEGYPTSDNSVTSPEGKSPKTQMGESTVNSSSKCNPTSQASSEGEIKTSCSAKQWDNYQDSSSVTATTLASVVDGNADMEDDDSLYKVERKTETPESKRRSIKVSRSEVKLFTKNVPLNPKQSPERDARDFKSALKETKGETRDTPKTKTDARLHDLKKIDEEPKPVAVRIKDKINLFERPARVADKKTFQAPRSADVSPVRNATERLKADFVLSEQRSRSAERYDAAKSSSSLTRERPIPIKDRVRNFTEAFTRDERSALPPKPAMKGMSQKSMSSVAVVASKSPELDNQGKRDTDEQTQTNASFKITRKPEGRDTSDVAGKISIPKEQPTDCKTKEALESRTADQGKIAQQSGDSAAFSTTVNVEKTAEKTSHSPKNELSPVANGDISSHPQPRTITKEPLDNKPSRTPKAPASSEVNKLIPDTIQRSSMKKFHLPRGLSKDDSARQDTPSSWLDLDFPKRKPKAPVPKLSSAGSESNLLDTSGDLDDEDFVEKIKKLCAPFSLPPRKHNILRPPQPPFAMPAIKEDRLEKTFDPEEFKFGLRKQKFTVDTTPSMLAKLQHPETKKSGIKPARASLADRSILLSSLDVHSRLAREKPLVKDEDDVKEEKDEQIKVKSRLEGSCVFSNLNSSIRGKRNQTENTNSGEVSPSESPQPSPSPSSQPPPPSPTATAPIKDALSKQSSATRNREETQAAEAVVSDSGLPFPSFNDIKLPDYLEKYLPSREPAKPEQSTQGQEVVKTEVIGKMSTPASGDEPDRAVKPGRVLPDAAPPSFPGNLSTTHPPLPELKQPLAKAQKKLTKKMVLFEKAQFSGQPYEIYRDVADATSLQLSHLISVMVVRGCWVLYEKPDFQGRTIALEEGGIELTNMWAEPGQETEPRSDPPMIIGSIRLAVWDYSIPHIDLFTEPEGLGRVTPYHDDTIETGSFGIPLSTASIQVHSGVWLVFSDPGFQGMLAVLETGVYPFPEAWGFPSPFIGSLRPLKIGGFKVENPTEVKAVVYEKPGFEGSCLEIDSDVFCFGEGDEGIAADEANLDSKKLNSVGSLKIVGGFWVGYSEPGFEGQQHILEEGEYLDCSDWGSSEPLLSLRPVLADFLSPHLKMFSDRDFGERGVNIDITVPVINMDDTGYGLKTQSIDVIGGVWVVFEEPGFCGEPYILEKGLYGNPEDWGALQHRVASAMPVVLFDFENADKFKVQLFSEPGFQGSVQTLGDSRASLQDGFTVGSCKVLAGSWLAFEGRDFAGRMYVLEVGSYSDLRAMGCFHAGSSILSLQTAGFEFSLPSITLFERGGLRGKRVILTDGSVNLQLAGGCSRVQSVLVEGGMWVLYEGINYRGAQILLKPGEVPDWRRFSSWLKIGSLRPLIQKQVHFRLRNRQSGLMMTVTGDLDDVKLMRIQETEETDGIDQIWSYRNGHLHCKVLEECCMGPSGSVTIAGSRVGLTPETSHHLHLWSITPEGFIRYTPTSDLVLEVKGGHHYDKNQVILNTFDPNKPQQRWNVEVI